MTYDQRLIIGKIGELSAPLPDSNVNAQTFIDFMTLLRARHPETKKFILYLDNARYFHAVMAREWIDALQKREGPLPVARKLRGDAGGGGTRPGSVGTLP